MAVAQNQTTSAQAQAQTEAEAETNKKKKKPLIIFSPSPIAQNGQVVVVLLSVHLTTTNPTKSNGK